jgi:hypothetical protein
MQFILNGPDIPDALIQAHEEGRVVFFCGAGISYPAGLPGFSGLVKKIYQLVGDTPSKIERNSCRRGQFDTTLHLLEQRIPKQLVRQRLAEGLTPNLDLKGATDTHAALLRLARSRKDELRLVTTNFDRIFHEAAKRAGQAFETFSAPMLPVPKNSRWNGLVYLHGLLPEKLDDTTTLNRLVVTSGDFGLAYLTERWAARFVSELFRNYVVCFVGYSINDPVLRYMMDALAADRMLGEVTPQAWALGDCEPGKEHRKAIEWEAKGVTPILYSLPAGSHDHSALHQTLHAWADTYRDGVQGKEAIVVRHALTHPQNSSQQDDFVGRMLWALSDKSGLPAKCFADFNPAPPLDWLLEAFSDKCFEHSDLVRFGISPHDKADPKMRFSLICRPTPYDRAPLMMLTPSSTESQWDEVMYHLARWLVRHLDDPRLILWITQHGGQLHYLWQRQIEHKLNDLASKEHEGKTSELDEIRLQAPKAIPSPLMRTLWSLQLSGHVKSPRSNPTLLPWKNRFKWEGLTTALRLELRKLLTPKVTLKEPLRSLGDANSANEPTRLKQLVDWKLVLAADYVHSALRDLTGELWKSALPQLFEDFQLLLRDTLDLLRELGEADDHSDRSHWALPSITPHWQNQGFHDWVKLIELLRDAWLAIRANERARATRIAQNWFELPYPTFKRLALFAASQDDCIRPEQWVDWLLSDNAWWLWSANTKREVCRLLLLQGRHLAGPTQERLEQAILAGPPCKMYCDDLETDRWQNLVARSVWLYLAKLNRSGLALGAPAAARLAETSTTYPQWQLATNERDEFSHWMSGTGDPDYEDSRDVDIAPRKRQELVQWLTKPMPERRPFCEDTWREVCRSRFFHSLSALYDLAQNDVWPTGRWREALQAWSEEGMVLRSWRYAAPLVQTMPDVELQEIAHSATQWMETVSKSIQHHEDILLKLCHRVLSLPLKASSGITRNGEPIDQPVTEAINHPVGRVTQALINLWLKQNPNDNDLLPANLKPLFTTLCDAQTERFRHGRVLLGAQLIAFFRVDRPWTEQHLLPLFGWNNPTEAKAVWQGFFWSPRLYPPLLSAFKSQFLDCANHYAKLGEHRQQFAAFLTYAALNPIEGYSKEEFRSAISALPQEGLEESAQALYQALTGAGDQREDFWNNQIQPFWQHIWPKSRNLVTPRISASLARLIIAARGKFPEALTTVQHWLKPIEHSGYVVPLLLESGLCKRFPTEAVRLLSAVITDQQWASEELKRCLDEIVQTAPELESNDQYQQLRIYYEKYSS